MKAETQQTLGIIQSVCDVCRRTIPARVIVADGAVYFDKFCPEHGAARHRVHDEPEHYLQDQRYVKPALMPRVFSGQADQPCPGGCGICARHEQHLCLPIVEITSRCNLSCPICIADAGKAWDMDMEQFGRLMDTLVAAEAQVDVLNISGGEPLLHPRLLEMIDNALGRSEIVRVSISTNGLVLLEQPQLLRELKRRNVVVSLQLDGFDDRVYQVLRGRPLLRQKQAILDMLGESQTATSLTVTAVDPLNMDQLPALVSYLFANRHVLSMMIQPLAFAGRGSTLSSRFNRLAIPGVIQRLGRMGDTRVSASDFVPLPCSHPLCFSLAYYLMLDDGGTLSLNQLVQAATMMDLLANRTIFGLDSREQEKLKDVIYEIWSGPAGCAPDSEKVMATLRRILGQISAAGGDFDPRRAFTVAERNIKSIFIHAFQDAATFDLSRARRCCQAYLQPDGRLIPVCVHNVLGRTSGAGAAKGV